MAFLLFWLWKELWRFKVKLSMLFAKILTLIKTKRHWKWKIRHTLVERQTYCASDHKNLKLKVKWMSWGSRKKKESIFCNVYFVQRIFFQQLHFISMYSVLNTLSLYTYFHISKRITSYTFLLVVKIVESLILNFCRLYSRLFLLGHFE